jgi:hypothetical protein
MSLSDHISSPQINYKVHVSIYVIIAVAVPLDQFDMIQGN